MNTLNLLNRAQLSCISTLVSKLNLKERKKEMVMGFSNGRVESSTALRWGEANAMIKHLKSLDPDEVVADKMRKKIISFAHEMSWTVLKDGKKKADMKRIDDFCIKSGYLKKKLNQYNYKELPMLVTQFERVYNSFLKNI